MTSAARLLFWVPVLALSGCGGAPPRAPWVRPEIQDPPDRVAPETELRKKLPPLAVAPHFVPPKIHESRLSNGVRVLVVERHDFPTVAISVVSDRGAADLAPAVSDFTVHAMLQGTKTRDDEDVARAFHYIGGRRSTLAHHSLTAILAESVSTDVVVAWKVIADVVQNPTFPEKRMVDVRREASLQLSDDNHDPSSQVQSLVREMLYPATHPYHLRPAGDPTSLAAVTRPQIVSAWGKLFTADRLTIVVVGDVDDAAALPALEEHFGKVGGKSPAPPVVPPSPPAPKETRVVFVDHPGDSQANVSIGWLGISRDAPDWVPLLVALDILSVSLFDDTRGAHGSTYGTHVDVDASRGTPPLRVSGAFEATEVGTALADMRGTVKRLSDQPVTETQLASAKAHLHAKATRSWDTAVGIVQVVSTLAAFGLPLDTYQKLPERIDAVTAADVTRVATTYLDAGKMSIAMVGDAKTVRPLLEKAGFSKIELR